MRKEYYLSGDKIYTLLYIKPLNSVTIRFKAPVAQYSNDGYNWTDVNINTSSGPYWEDITFTKTVFVRLNGRYTSIDEDKGFEAIAGHYEIGGDVRQLRQEYYSDHDFEKWFLDDEYLISAEKLNLKDFILEAKKYQLINYPSQSFTVNFTKCFEGCVNLQKAPKLKDLSVLEYNNNEYAIPITYTRMFYNCSSLQTAPDIEMAGQYAHCEYMFYNCSLIKNLPYLGNLYWYAYFTNMFAGCSNLEEVYDFSHANITDGSLAHMFDGCSKIKISETQTDEYINSIKITEFSSLPNLTLTDMFANTGGTFAGTPSSGVTYYTSNTTK